MNGSGVTIPAPVIPVPQAVLCWSIASLSLLVRVGWSRGGGGAPPHTPTGRACMCTCLQRVYVRHILTTDKWRGGVDADLRLLLYRHSRNRGMEGGWGVGFCSIASHARWGVEDEANECLCPCAGWAALVSHALSGVLLCYPPASA